MSASLWHLAKPLLAFCLLYLTWMLLAKRTRRPFYRSVAIVVLGDIGRSPRMMYHAESFAKDEFETYLIGYAGSRPLPSLLSVPHVRLLHLAQPPKFIPALPRALFPLFAPYKVFRQIVSLLWALLWIPKAPQFILVQNPPTIPTLAVVWLAAWLRGSKVIIDWHNLGYSILALRLGENHVFVKLAKAFEAYFGRKAFAHLFVTRAMRDHLVKEWGLQGHKAVLHDRPPAHFEKSSPAKIHDLFLRITTLFPSPTLDSFLPPQSPTSTPLTSLSRPTSSNPTSTFHAPSPEPMLRKDRPALLITSTSWTPDEDFDLLLSALAQYETRAREINEHGQASKLPKVLMIVTGKGPLRDSYVKEIAKRERDEKWEWVRCRSLWVEAGDYPVLLGSADLGISLHSSSSGLDLPMKVVDMFGCGLPVCALDFACLQELVKDGINGLVFRTAEELASQIETLLKNFPNSSELERLQSSLRRETTHSRGMRLSPSLEDKWGTWEENWNRVVKPLVSHDLDAEADQWFDQLAVQRMEAQVKSGS